MRQGQDLHEVVLSPVILRKKNLHRLPDLGDGRNGNGSIEGVSAEVVIAAFSYKLLRPPVFVTLHDGIPGDISACVAGGPGENGCHGAVSNILGLIQGALVFFDAGLQINMLLHIRVLLLSRPFPFIGAPDVAATIRAALGSDDKFGYIVPTADDLPAHAGHPNVRVAAALWVGIDQLGGEVVKDVSVDIFSGAHLPTAHSAGLDRM